MDRIQLGRGLPEALVEITAAVATSNRNEQLVRQCFGVRIRRSASKQTRPLLSLGARPMSVMPRLPGWFGWTENIGRLRRISARLPEAAEP
jgi:hypothetical protein